MILFNTACGIYLIQKESKYTAVFLSISTETQCIPLLLPSIFLTYAPSFILGKLFLEKNVIKYKLVIEIISNLHIAQRMEWN